MWVNAWNDIVHRHYMIDRHSRSSIRVIRMRKRIRIESLSGCRFPRTADGSVCAFLEKRQAASYLFPSCSARLERPSGTIPRHDANVGSASVIHAFQRRGRDFCASISRLEGGGPRFAANNWIIVSALWFLSLHSQSSQKEQANDISPRMIELLKRSNLFTPLLRWLFIFIFQLSEK